MTSIAPSEVLTLPTSFTFYRHGYVDFDKVLGLLDWNAGKNLTIDLTKCESANFQALALLIQYAWRMTLNGCSVTFRYGGAYSRGPTKMFSKMGAVDWREILAHDGKDFGHGPGSQTFAIRRRSDVQSIINEARRSIRSYSVGFPEYLSYIISELLYNAAEHGKWCASLDNCQILVPGVFQFGNYQQLKRLSFIFSDLGVGIKSHLEQSFPPFSSHQEAIAYALRPNVSGTSLQQSGPYASKNNAGMGLTYSSLMLKRLHGDMYIVSHDGLVHVSPEDVTTRKLEHNWPGTFVLINLNVADAPSVTLDSLLAEIRLSARKELEDASEKEGACRYVVSVFNYFGKWAEDKDAAIQFRDRHLLPAIEQGKRIDLDFQDVETAPHSFLNALLATPVRRLGVMAYQRIRIYNALGSIHETVDTIIEENVPKIC